MANESGQASDNVEHSDSGPSTVTLNIRCLDGKDAKLQVPREIVLQNLAEQISEKFNVTPDRVRMIYRGSCMDVKERLTKYVKDYSQEHAIHVVFRKDNASIPSNVPQPIRIPETAQATENPTGDANVTNEPSGNLDVFVGRVWIDKNLDATGASQMTVTTEVPRGYGLSGGHQTFLEGLISFADWALRASDRPTELQPNSGSLTQTTTLPTTTPIVATTGSENIPVIAENLGQTAETAHPNITVLRARQRRGITEGVSDASRGEGSTIPFSSSWNPVNVTQQFKSMSQSARLPRVFCSNGSGVSEANVSLPSYMETIPRSDQRRSEAVDDTNYEYAGTASLSQSFPVTAETPDSSGNFTNEPPGLDSAILDRGSEKASVTVIDEDSRAHFLRPLTRINGRSPTSQEENFSSTSDSQTGRNETGPPNQFRRVVDQQQAGSLHTESSPRNRNPEDPQSGSNVSNPGGSGMPGSRLPQFRVAVGALPMPLGESTIDRFLSTLMGSGEAIIRTELGLQPRGNTLSNEQEPVQEQCTRRIPNNRRSNASRSANQRVDRTYERGEQCRPSDSRNGISSGMSRFLATIEESLAEARIKICSSERSIKKTYAESWNRDQQRSRNYFHEREGTMRDSSSNARTVAEFNRNNRDSLASSVWVSDGYISQKLPWNTLYELMMIIYDVTGWEIPVPFRSPDSCRIPPISLFLMKYKQLYDVGRAMLSKIESWQNSFEKLPVAELGYTVKFLALTSQIDANLAEIFCLLFINFSYHVDPNKLGSSMGWNDFRKKVFSSSQHLEDPLDDDAFTDAQERPSRCPESHSPEINSNVSIRPNTYSYEREGYSRRKRNSSSADDLTDSNINGGPGSTPNKKLCPKQATNHINPAGISPSTDFGNESKVEVETKPLDKPIITSNDGAKDKLLEKKDLASMSSPPSLEKNEKAEFRGSCYKIVKSEKFSLKGDHVNPAKKETAKMKRDHAEEKTRKTPEDTAISNVSKVISEYNSQLRPDLTTNLMSLDSIKSLNDVQSLFSGLLKKTDSNTAVPSNKESGIDKLPEIVRQRYSRWTGDKAAFSAAIVSQARVRPFSRAYASGNSSGTTLSAGQEQLPSVTSIFSLSWRQVLSKIDIAERDAPPPSSLNRLYIVCLLKEVADAVRKNPDYLAEPERFPNLTELLSIINKLK